VALAGGCFQNALLLELTAAALRCRGLEPFWPRQLPCNDGGLALGQLWAALHDLPITKQSPR
jgi:hydrogenase maturation protein HypF